MRVRKFYSVEDAYQRWGFWKSVEGVAAAVTIGDVLIAPNLWVIAIGGGTWWVVDKSRQTFQRLFWNQAEMLHTSTASGEPGIYRFMSPKHQRQLAQKSFDKFSKER